MMLRVHHQRQRRHSQLELYGFLCLVLLRRLPTPVTSVPYYFLSTTRPKCLRIEPSRGVTLNIAYYCPDMIILPDKVEDLPTGEELDAALGNGTGGSDSIYNARYKARLEAMRRAGRVMKDMNIVVQQRAEPPQGATSQEAREWRRRRAERNKAGSGRIREELSLTNGTLVFQTGEDEGYVEICVQSMSANPVSPSMYQLQVTESVTEEDGDSDTKREEEQPPSPDVAAENEKLISQHMSRMQVDLLGLERKLHVITNNANNAKRQEIDFQATTRAMRGASIYWPIIRLIVLVVSGAAQANGIINYMRRHRIY